MSADNGVFLTSGNESGKYEVVRFSGGSTNKVVGFNTIEEALTYIQDNCNDTEYGITLVGFDSKLNQLKEE